MTDKTSKGGKRAAAGLIPAGGGVARAAGAVVNDAASGRFVGGVGLTVKQSAFVTAFISNGGSLTGAARSAGYSTPESAGWHLGRHPAIAAEIRLRQIASLSGLATVGIQTLRAVMEDETAPAAARVQASRFALEAAGFGIQAEALKLRFAGVGAEKDLATMSIAELQDLALMVKAEVDTLADRQTAAIRSDKAPMGDAVSVEAVVCE